MTANRIYRLLPGKSGDGGAHLPLWMHLEDTAYAAEFLCADRTADSVIHACGMTREEFGKICVFLAMVHDIGKCTPLFEARILQAIPQRRDVLGGAGLDIPDISAFIYDTPRHAGAGQEILKDFGCRYGVCAVVGAHHGKPVSEKDDMAEPLAVYPKNFYAKQRDLWRGMQRAVLDNALARAGYAAIEELPVLSNCAQMLLCGMLIQADWIASNTAYFPLLSEDEEGKPEDCPVRGARAFAALSLPGVWNADYEWHGSESFYALRFGFSPNSMQRLTAEAARSMPEGGLMIVEAQMGTGKTEAAMAAAEILSKSAGCGGVFFGLPTQATSNGIFSRVAGWAEKISQNSTHTIRLVHGMAELNTDYRAYFPSGKNTDCEGIGGLEAHSWFAGRKQALLADFVVGTVDSALMAALSQKHVMLRHLGLCGKTVIIDECHAYDAYMSRFLLRMLRWLGAYRVPVILLSATLPRERKEEMLREYINGRRTGTDEFEIITFPQDTGYPLITWTEGDKVLARAAQDTAAAKQVKAICLSEDGLEDDLNERLTDGGCAGIIVNTVKRAQDISRRLQQRFPDKKVYVYHAQFTAEERIRREKELMAMIGKKSSRQDRENVIIVGTQVLEQSLDIDFDYLITDLCPMDLLLQRIGRLHRHERPRPGALEKPVCSVLCACGEPEQGAARIYDRYILERTRRYLPGTVRLPEDIPRLVNLVYEPDETDPEWGKYRDKLGIKESKAENWVLPPPKYSKRERRNSIVGMLDVSADSDKRAEAAVRDGLPSVDVLAMRMADEGRLTYLSGAENEAFRADSVPSEQESRRIAMQRLRLPFVFCCGTQLENTIGVLERENTERLAAWQSSPWLKGELVLVFDKNGERELCGYRLRYSADSGLRYERIGDANE